MEKDPQLERKPQAEVPTLDSSNDYSNNKDEICTNVGQTNKIESDMSGLKTVKDKIENELTASTIKSKQNVLETIKLQKEQDNSIKSDLQGNEKETKQPTKKEL
eukprot:TRINITY_DN12206_c0_g1_i1.p1 TRINITY_DN12206_c0_g1~~TRINITY_DN12206_c0_g1_i1.p1  ORF type:complete len:104 (-),score=27.55 TRINITY_DN12206_c0_g1_i1:53-364(-)